ncbi:MAG: hypothetical protein VXZ72_02535 [Chlamydiota bacterium]|nr:hypothetical protein [Chlamydiota bacterium]
MKKESGMSVEEMQRMGKKYRYQVVMVGYLLLSTFFSFIFWQPWWSIIATGLGGGLGTCFSCQVECGIHKVAMFLKKQERPTKIALAISGGVISLFLPPLVFLLVGFLGGSGMARFSPHDSHATKNENVE